MHLVRLTPSHEVLIWVVADAAAVAALFLGHTFYVTAATYWYGLLLFVLTAFLFRFRFRTRTIEAQRWMKIVFNANLVLLSAVALLYFLGVATYYE